MSHFNLDKGEVLIHANGPGKFAFTVTTDDHEIQADEPTEMGSTNLGPDPFEFFLTSVGTCKAMTLRMYADHKKLSVDDIAIRLKGTKTKESYNIDISISVTGDITQEQCDRLLEIADKCPVHKTLEGQINFNSSIV